MDTGLGTLSGPVGPSTPLVQAVAVRPRQTGANQPAAPTALASATSPGIASPGIGIQAAGMTPTDGQMSMGREQLLARVDEVNQTLQQLDGSYHVSVDDATGLLVVRITDGDTGEVVKQVPPQQVLDASVSVEKIIGLLVNERA